MNNIQHSIRVIARLDIKSENVIKGVSFEGLRVMGHPKDLAMKYVDQGADELIYIDTVASLYGRNNLYHVLQDMAQNIHIPITAGGGVSSLEDIDMLLKSGADKVAINTYAVKDPALISKAANKYGSQCIVSSIVVKKIDNNWFIWTDNAREPTNIKLLDWILKVQELGAGEILLTSIDNDGKMGGFDNELIDYIYPFISVPVIIGSGFNSVKSCVNILKKHSIDAISIGSALHYNECTIGQIKQDLNALNYKTYENKLSDTNFEFYDDRKKVSIIDYGVGNIFGLTQSLKKIGVKVNLVKTVKEIEESEKIILPGVGSFPSAMNALHELKIVDAIRTFAHSGKPIMGICLGAQILLEKGFEGNICEGLSLIPGEVKLIEGNSCKVPHIGWNLLQKEAESPDYIFSNLSFDEALYFVHSYEMKTEKKYIISTVNYCNKKIVSGVANNNIFGFQFHPEKSGLAGLNILYNFAMH